MVVLKLNDKPLSGAQVKLSMIFTPGSDYTFTPESGVTDATRASASPKLTDSGNMSHAPQSAHRRNISEARPKLPSAIDQLHANRLALPLIV